MKGYKSPTAVLTHFAENTSAHGIKKLTDRNGIFFRMIWLLLLLGATSMFVFQVYGLVGQFRQRPTTTKTILHNRNLIFPSVTICNLNPLLNSKIQNHSINSPMKKIADWLGISLSYFLTGNLGTGYPTFPNVTFSTNDPILESSLDFRMRLQGLSLAELLPLSQPFDHFVISCYYGRYSCDSRNFTMSVERDYGICYTFPRKDQYPDGIQVHDAGPLFGLKLVLNANQKEYIPFLIPSAGARLQVHEFGSKPHMKELGYSVSTGFNTEIGITPIIYKRRPAPYGTCDNSGRFQNVLECERLCMEQLIEGACNCTRRTNQTSLSLCVSEDIPCILQVVQDKQAGLKSCTACQPTCRVYDFSYRFSMTRWPANHYDLVLWSTLYKKPNFHPDINMVTREELLYVRVYFSQLLLRIMEEEPSYLWQSFISDFGGQLGLWLGISVLSLCEVLELIPLLVKSCFPTQISRAPVTDDNLKY